MQLQPCPGGLALAQGPVAGHRQHRGGAEAGLHAGVGQRGAQDYAEGDGDVVLRADSKSGGETLGLSADAHQGSLQEVGETRDGLHAYAGHVVSASSCLEHSQDAVVGPGQMLQFY